MDLIVYVTILIVSFCDGIRDGNVARRAAWLPWHIVKWIDFYSPIVLLMICVGFTVPEVIILALASWALWKIGYSMRLPSADS